MLFFALPYAARANEPNVGAATSRAMHTVRPTQANHEIVCHVGISKMLDRFEKGFGFAFHDAKLARIGYCVKYVNAQNVSLPGCQTNAGWIAQSIDGGVNFCAQP